MHHLVFLNEFLYHRMMDDYNKQQMVAIFDLASADPTNLTPEASSSSHRPPGPPHPGLSVSVLSHRCVALSLQAKKLLMRALAFLQMHYIERSKVSNTTPPCTFP